MDYNFTLKVNDEQQNNQWQHLEKRDFIGKYAFYHWMKKCGENNAKK